jgi:hypothetical protein
MSTCHHMIETVAANYMKTSPSFSIHAGPDRSTEFKSEVHCVLGTLYRFELFCVAFAAKEGTLNPPEEVLESRYDFLSKFPPTEAEEIGEFGDFILNKYSHIIRVGDGKYTDLQSPRGLYFWRKKYLQAGEWADPLLVLVSMSINTLADRSPHEEIGRLKYQCLEMGLKLFHDVISAENIEDQFRLLISGPLV